MCYHSVMTESWHCRSCSRVIEQKPRGRPKEFCSGRCRQAHWVASRRAVELSLAEGELIVAKEELESLHDDLYVLACAVDDTERDLAEPAISPQDLRRILDWLLAAARPLRDRELRHP